MANSTVGNGAAYFREFLDTMKISWSQVVSNGYDDKAQKFSCEGLLTITLIDGSAITKQTEFSTQRTADGKDFLVALRGAASLIDKIGIKAAVHTVNKLGIEIKKSEGESDQYIGSYTGKGEGEVELKIKQGQIVDQYRVSMSTATEGCAGSAEGVGVRVGHILNITARDGEDICKVKAEFTTNGAVILEEVDGCSFFHGAACGFSGQLHKKN
ncbi:hypothetical protein [Paucibacter sp. KCTC 42545]|uniref:hypothetical protein n=1 Tax=Paucibacter sp. KCTC 42545 TaxID=1768242 RepID=UPI000733C333|nr:hypothetical protein [Paucibacter sp. KCTC 42545]ALT77974.1 hypothetical protein AT984_13080 [Paucibacter sp. KCTC 42545]